MAEKITLVDDLDGSEKSVERLTFSINGDHYEIDLSEKNIEELRTAVAPYQAVARPLRVGVSKNGPTSSAPKRAKQPRKTSKTPTASEVREWAKANKVPVNATGNPRKEVLEKYLAAH